MIWENNWKNMIKAIELNSSKKSDPPNMGDRKWKVRPIRCFDGDCCCSCYTWSDTVCFGFVLKTSLHHQSHHYQPIVYKLYKSLPTVQVYITRHLADTLARPTVAVGQKNQLRSSVLWERVCDSVMYGCDLFQNIWYFTVLWWKVKENVNQSQV